MAISQNKSNTNTQSMHSNYSDKNENNDQSLVSTLLNKIYLYVDKICNDIQKKLKQDIEENSESIKNMIQIMDNTYSNCVENSNQIKTIEDKINNLYNRSN